MRFAAPQAVSPIELAVASLGSLSGGVRLHLLQAGLRSCSPGPPPPACRSRLVCRVAGCRCGAARLLTWAVCWLPGRDGPLIAAAVRHVKSQLGLDLSPCQHWLRCCEVHFSRPGPLDVPEIPEVPTCTENSPLWLAARAGLERGICGVGREAVGCCGKPIPGAAYTAP